MSEVKRTPTLPHLVGLGFQRHTELTGCYVIGNVVPIAYVSSEAEAKMLIRAVNCHDELLAALKLAQERLRDDYHDGISIIDEAIERAETGPRRRWPAGAARRRAIDVED